MPKQIDAKVKECCLRLVLDRPPQPLIVAFIDEMRAERHAVESPCRAGACWSRAVRSPRGVTGTGAAPLGQSRRGRSPTPRFTIGCVTWPGH